MAKKQSMPKRTGAKQAPVAASVGVSPANSSPVLNDQLLSEYRYIDDSGKEYLYHLRDFETAWTVQNEADAAPFVAKILKTDYRTIIATGLQAKEDAEFLVSLFDMKYALLQEADALYSLLAHLFYPDVQPCPSFVVRKTHFQKMPFLQIMKALDVFFMHEARGIASGIQRYSAGVQ